MTYTIPEDAQRLVARLRQLADEVESAARYGVPVPNRVNVGGHKNGGASFAATVEEFAAWADYAEATVEEYDHDGSHWRKAEADVNGLPVDFFVRVAPVAAVSA